MILATDNVNHYGQGKYSKVRETSKQRRRRKQKKILLKRLFILIVGIGVFLAYLLFSWQTNLAANELQTIQQELDRLHEENIKLEVSVNEGHGLKKVEHVATQYLGMVKPDQSQIIVVKELEIIK